MGSDLGNNCFQFRFEREDDLQRVLDNRPYHFAYWMVIIQRWEPVISSSFPSAIPFWIRIKGIPLHYWHEDTVSRVGQELGTIENHELTRTTARVRVLIDGLKPLIKESILEFDSGEESLLTLEYERLELHCSYCFSLLHSRKHCPKKQEEDAAEPVRSGPPPNYRSTRSHEGETVRPLLGGESRTTPALINTTNGYPRRASVEEAQKGKLSKETAPDPQDFNLRVDRHGNQFGDRVGTKQTRNPPPEKRTDLEESSKQNRHQISDQEKYDFPPYSKNREYPKRLSQRGRDLFPQRSEGQWRPKRTIEPETQQAREEEHRDKTPAGLDRNALVVANEKGTQPRSKEDIMEDLHEVTRQYLSCSDPVEAAARRQRVQYSDEQGLMEKTAASIMSSMLPASLCPQYSDGNPVTPPTSTSWLNSTSICATSARTQQSSSQRSL